MALFLIVPLGKVSMKMEPVVVMDIIEEMPLVPEPPVYYVFVENTSVNRGAFM
jgi:hypothetical protein